MFFLFRRRAPGFCFQGADGFAHPETRRDLAGKAANYFKKTVPAGSGRMAARKATSKKRGRINAKTLKGKGANGELSDR